MKRTLTIFLVLVLTISIFAKDPQAGEGEGSVKLVSSVTADIGTVEVESTYWGVISSDEMVNVVSKYPGRLRKINKEEGDRVKKGDILYTVDRELTGMKYNMIEEKAPISGLIIKRHASPGQFIGPSMPVYTIVNDRKLYAAVNVFAEELDKIKDSKGIFLNAKGKEYSGKLSKAVAYGNPMNGMITIKLSFDKVELILNQRVEIRIVETTQDGIIIPIDAIIKDNEGNQHVFIILNGTAVKTPVETGLKNDYKAIITKGIEKGDEIIYIGAYLVNDGDKVKITK